MEWSHSTLWWIAAGVLVAAELTSGTFYLLMLALGTVAAAIAALLGASLPAQFIAAALVGGGAVVAWHLSGGRHRLLQRAERGHKGDVAQLDVGERVQVKHWSADGTARVQYRGSSWDARFAGPGAPAPGEHVIRAVEGTRLLLGR